MFLIDELFLLLTDDDGSMTTQTYLHPGLLAAAMTDLVLAERVTLGPEKDPKVRVLDPTPVGHPVVDDLLRRAVVGKRLSRLVCDQRIKARPETGNHLQRLGIVGPGEKHGFLGIGVTHHTVIDPTPERELRARLAAALKGQAPTAGDAALLAILQALGCAHVVLRAEAAAAGLDKKALKARITEAVGQVSTADSVRQSIEGMYTSIATSVIVAGVITAGS